MSNIRVKPGDRVEAILSSTDSVVKFLGYGVYDGDLPCPLIENIPNPRITLDDLNVVWGCQCWWGPEENIKQHLEGMEIIQTRIEVIS